MFDVSFFFILFRCIFANVIYVDATLIFFYDIIESDISKHFLYTRITISKNVLNTLAKSLHFKDTYTI